MCGEYGVMTGLLQKDEDGFFYFCKSSSLANQVYVYSNIVLDRYVKSIITLYGDITFDEEGNPESISHFHSPSKYNLPTIVVKHEAYS